MDGMTSENVLFGLILTGMGLCVAYFWAEMALRKQDRARSETGLAAPPTAIKRLFGAGLAGPTRKIDRQEAA